MMKRATMSAIGAGLVISTGASAAVTDFESGLEGWSVSGRTNIDATGGNPGAHLDNVLIDVFGADIRNSTNPDVLGDLSRYPMFELTVDVRINSITFGSNEVSRDFIVDLRSDVNNDGIRDSVFFNLGTLSRANSEMDDDGWITYSVLVEDPNSSVLPMGWSGSGAEDPNTFEPVLPEGVTFADVVGNVEELAFTTFVPGFFFGFTNFDIEVDNVGINVIPAPSTAMILGAGGILAARRRR